MEENLQNGVLPYPVGFDEAELFSIERKFKTKA